MQEANSPPIPGPIILAKVGRPPSGDPAPAHDTAPKGKSLPRGQTMLARFEVLALWSGVTLSLAAALHRQWAGLLWLGAVVWCSLMIAALLLPLGRHRRCRQQTQSLTVPPDQRDERTVVLIDRLKEYTASGALGTPAPATGAVAWLTDEGLYLQNGKHLPWSSFQTFRAQPVSARVLSVQLYWRSLSPAATLLAGSYLLFWFLAGLAVSILGTVRGLHRFGLRDDVLALMIGTCFWSVLLISLVLLYVQERSGARRPANIWLALVNREAASADDVQRLLSRHLPEHHAAA